jgi:WD40 repeat protein/tetratricopeptide (TPR) repeat protein
VQEEHKLTRVSRIVAEKAARWREAGERADYLLEGVELAEAKAWRDKYPDQLGPDEQGLLTESIKQAEEKVRQEEALKYTQRLEKQEIRRQEALKYSKVLENKNRRLKFLFLSALALFVLAVYLGVRAWQSANEAAEQRVRNQVMEEEKHNRQKRSVSTYVANGVRQMDAGNMEHALIWFTEAFALDAEISANEDDFSKREQIHRTRLATVLQRCPRMVQMLWHEGPINSSEMSFDGTRVVTASEDGTARIWDRATGQLLQTLSHKQPGRPVSVRHASFSPCGAYVVTAADDNTAVVWETASGKPHPPLRHGDLVRRAVFSPKGDLLVTVSKDRTAKLWKVQTGEPLHTLEHEGFVYFAAFSPNGQRLVTACADNEASVRVWDVDRGTPLTKPLPRDDYSGVASYVSFASFDPKGDLIVTAGTKGDVVIREATTGKVKHRTRWQDGRVDRASFTADGTRVLTVTSSGLQLDPRLWDPQLWDKSTASLELPAKGYSEHHPAFTPEGRFRAYWANMDHAVQVRDEAAAKPRSQMLGKLKSASFQGDCNHLLTIGEDKVLRVWPLVRGQPGPTPLTVCDGVTSAWMSPKGQQILTIQEEKAVVPILGTNTVGLMGSAQGQGPLLAASVLFPGRTEKRARIWDANKGRSTAELWPPPSINFAVFSQNGRQLVTVGVDGSVCTWDATTGAAKHFFLGHGDAVSHAAFNPESSLVITTSRDFTARLWETDPANSRTMPTLWHKGWVLHATFSPDGRKVLTTSSDKTACVWDIASGERLNVLKHAGQVLEASFSRTDETYTRVVTVCEDKTARIWNTESGQATTPPLEHKDLIKHARFSPDGLYVLTVTEKYARIWDATSGDPITPLLEQSGLLDAAFDSEGVGVITVGRDGTMRWWDLPRDPRPIPDLVRLAQLSSGKQLDRDRDWLVPCPTTLLRENWDTLRLAGTVGSAPSSEAVVEWHRQEAKDAEKTQDWNVVRRHLDKLLEADPRQESLWEKKSKALAELGIWSEALTACTYAIAAKPKNATLWYQRGRVHAKLGDFDKALKDYQEALTRAPDDGSIFLAQSLAHAQRGDLGTATKDYKKAAEKFSLARPRLDCWWSSHSAQHPAMQRHWQEIISDCPIPTMDERRQELSAEVSTATGKREATDWIYYCNRGLAYCGLGKWAEAASDFRQAKDLKADEPSVWQGAARALMETRSWVEAEDACSRAITLDVTKKDWGSFYLRGIARRMNGRYGDAVADYTEAIERGAIGWGILAERGYAYNMLKNYDGAIRDYSEVLRVHADATVHNNLGFAYRNAGDYEKALLNYTEAIRLNQRDIHYRNRANAHFDQGVYEQAVADYSNALQLAGSNASTYSQRGRAYAALFDFDQAIRDYTRAIELNPKDPACYNYRGYAYQRKRDTDKAMENYGLALQVNPQFSGARLNLANLELMRGQKQKAEETIRGVIDNEKKLAQSNPSVVSHQQDLALGYENLGVLLQLTERLEGSESAFREALSLRQKSVQATPRDKLARRTLATCYEKLGSSLNQAGQTAEAEKAYLQALTIKDKLSKDFPTSPDCQNSLAWLLVSCPLKRLRDADRAVEQASRAVRRASFTPTYWNTLGVAHYRAGKWTEAVGALDRAVALASGGDITDWLFLAMAHKQLGNLEKARHWYHQAVVAMDKDQVIDPSRRLFREEAAALLDPHTPVAKDNQTQR